MDYDTIGVGYAQRRGTDPRWLTAIEAALGAAGSVSDVGAGTGSYEPAGRTALAVEPSAEMVRQRPAGAASVVRALAERLPVASNAVDAALADRKPRRPAGTGLAQGRRRDAARAVG